MPAGVAKRPSAFRLVATIIVTGYRLDDIFGGCRRPRGAEVSACI